MKKKPETVLIVMRQQMSVDDVLEMLSDCSHEFAFELIQQIDLALADWEFTERVYKHFAAEMEKLPAEDRQ